jgi:lipopolysaccharide transport system ATP-binding protein
MKQSLAIQATNLSKKYRLGTIGMTSLREDLSRWWNRSKIESPKNGFNQAGIEHSRMLNEHEFWALKDLNFQIPKGEVVGLIGANGSGKSTLLKILSRITEPTKGEVKIRGKVASLLEVGTGFHPELSGRENIYLNGATLGMTKREVDSKFDEIVDFSGVADFIETPIKRYSSGMTVRLGFAVAAHLEPDILIIDEVLAVGDAEFQKKCLGKIDQISGLGQTVIFVSHNMVSVEALCTSSFLMEKGKINMIGKTPEVISSYYEKLDSNLPKSEVNLEARTGTGEFRLKDISFFKSDNSRVKFIKNGEPLGIKVIYERQRECHGKISFCLSIDRVKPRIKITSLCSNFVECKIKDSKVLVFEIRIPKFNLKEMTCAINTDIMINDKISESVPNAIKFDIKPGDFYGNGSSFKKGLGQIMLDFEMKSVAKTDLKE